MGQDVAALHPLEVKALLAFKTGTVLGEDALVAASGLAPEHVRTAVQWLLGKNLIAKAEEKTTLEATLGDLGEAYRRLKVPELRLAEALAAGPSTVDGLRPQFAEYPDASTLGRTVGSLKKAGLLEAGAGGSLALVAGAAVKLAPFEALARFLDKLATAGILAVDALPAEERAFVDAHGKKRGKAQCVICLAERTVRRYSLVDPALLETLLKAGVTGDELTRLTPELLRDGTWRGKSFRRYSVAVQPPLPETGRRHPYRAFLDVVKGKLLSMGFKEMRGGLVENEFWNMDALFMPQFHSARDIHDVYYVENPTHARELEEPFATRVAETHENGGRTGSQGWGYRFDGERARRLILRSQGTCLSARTLASQPDVPGKYFAVARCFRYDRVDATHLADFFQIEGIVLGAGITFKTLLGLLQLFADEVAEAKEVKFVPAYFPFTEPSVELHARHPSLGWIELGGAGLFRPEVTEPLGIDVPVIAWGLGVDRMGMFAMGLEDIRDLFSRDLEFVRRLKVSRGKTGREE